MRNTASDHRLCITGTSVSCQRVRLPSVVPPGRWPVPYAPLLLTVKASGQGHDLLSSAVSSLADTVSPPADSPSQVSGIRVCRSRFLVTSFPLHRAPEFGMRPAVA